MALFSILPGFIFLYIIFLNLKNNDVKINYGIATLIIGFLSTGIITILHNKFPDFFGTAFFTKVVRNPLGYLVPINTGNTVLFKAFIQVALFEELAKFITFLVPFLLFKPLKEFKYTTSQIILMAAASHIGFGVLETYICYPEHSVFRIFTALPLHTLCGILMGFFISMGLQKRFYIPNENLSNMQVLFKTKPLVRKYYYFLLAFLVPILVHGFYDLNFMYTNNFTGVWFILINIILYYSTYRIFKYIRKNQCQIL